MFEIFGNMVSLADIIIAALVLVTAIFSCIKGIVAELSKWFGLFVGLMLGLMFYSQAGAFAMNYLPESVPAWAGSVIAFIVLFLIGFLLVILVGHMLAKIFDTFHLGWLDHVLGFAWGVALSFLVISVVVSILARQSLIDLSAQFNESLVISRFILPHLDQTMGLVTSAAQQGLSVVQNSDALAGAIEEGLSSVQGAIDGIQ